MALLKAMEEKDARQKGPAELAFVGDAVFELMVRGSISGRSGGAGAAALHRAAVEYVRAGAQSRALDWLGGLLSEEERGVARRGQNAHAASLPHGTDRATYSRATALEALFGYLYLCGREDRLSELFGVILRRHGEIALAGRAGAD
jgi:ribonuclease-3 family protein